MREPLEDRSRHDRDPTENPVIQFEGKFFQIEKIKAVSPQSEPMGGKTAAQEEPGNRKILQMAISVNSDIDKYFLFHRIGLSSIDAFETQP